MEESKDVKKPLGEFYSSIPADVVQVFLQQLPHVLDSFLRHSCELDRSPSVDTQSLILLLQEQLRLAPVDSTKLTSHEREVLSALHSHLYDEYGSYRRDKHKG